MTKAILIALTIALAASAATKEEKLADALIKANRAVSHADAKAQSAGKALDAYCQTVGARAGVSTKDGLWGCVMWQGAPLPPPTTVTPSAPSPAAVPLPPVQTRQLPSQSTAPPRDR